MSNIDYVASDRDFVSYRRGCDAIYQPYNNPKKNPQYSCQISIACHVVNIWHFNIIFSSTCRAQ